LPKFNFGRRGDLETCLKLTGNPEVIFSPVGLVPPNAPAVTDQSLARLPITNRGKPASDHFRVADNLDLGKP
jgi:hypothetical protein